MKLPSFPNIMSPKLIHTKEFRHAAIPPITTPDLAILQQHTHWQVFDWCNIVKNAPVRFKEAYTIPKYRMYFDMHEAGTPQLVFRQNMHDNESYTAMPGRLRGKTHLLSVPQIVELDKQQHNRLQLVRKLVRIVTPTLDKRALYINERTQRHDAIVPPTSMMWVYLDNETFWKPRFIFDYELWRGRQGKEFEAATQQDTHLDSRDFIGRYLAPRARKMIQRKWWPTFIDGDAHRAKDRTEENLWLAAHRPIETQEEPRRFIYITPDDIEKQDNPVTPALPQVS